MNAIVEGMKEETHHIELKISNIVHIFGFRKK